ncbi:MAG: serine hydrolase domain-containing protein [Chitinophagaceae bacterium]
MPNRFFRFCKLAGLIIAMIGCSSPKTSTKTQNKVFTEIDTFLQSLIDTAGIPGIAIAITKDQEIIYSKAFGVTNIQTKVKLETSHIFHIASVSKTFTATAVMQLVEKGRINMDEPLITYLPYFKLNDDRYKAIKIKQLLNHTSGMPDVEDYEWEKAVAGEDAAERYTRSLIDKKLISDPGAEFHYSNMAFDIMADLIAKVSGMSFEKYVKENILLPLQMDESSFYYPEIKEALRTSPHTGRPPIVSSIYPYNRMHAPSSTLNTNVLEMSHWAIANMYNGAYKGKQILTPGIHSLMMTPTFLIDADRKTSIGLSWFIYPYKELTNIEHGGSDLGYKSILTLIPQKKLGIVILANVEDIRMYDTRNKVRDLLLLN